MDLTGPRGLAFGKDMTDRRFAGIIVLRVLLGLCFDTVFEHVNVNMFELQ